MDDLQIPLEDRILNKTFLMYEIISLAVLKLSLSQTYYFIDGQNHQDV